MMTWHVPVLLVVLFGYCISPYLIKSIADIPGRAGSLVLQYFLASVFAFLGLIITQFFGLAEFSGNWQRMAVVAVICSANSFACYAHWRATGISQSITSIVAFADDLICLGLAFLILHQSKYLTAFIGLGILLVSASAIILVLSNTALKGIQREDILGVYKWTAIYSVIWGVLMFLEGYFAFKEKMPWWEFAASWYFGSFLASFLVFYFSSKEERGNFGTLITTAQPVLLNSITIYISLGLQYWSKIVAPLIVVIPIFQASEMIFPTLCGLIIFKERKHFKPLGWAAMAVGTIGGLLIALNY